MLSYEVARGNEAVGQRTEGGLLSWKGEPSLAKLGTELSCTELS